MNYSDFETCSIEHCDLELEGFTACTFQKAGFYFCEMRNTLWQRGDGIGSRL